MAYIINDGTCTNCGDCQGACPADAISEKSGKRWIDADKCLDCGACSDVCKVQAITGV